VPVKISVREAARMLEVSEKTIYRWIEQKKLPVHRINDQYRFNRAELLEWATTQRVPVSVEIFHEPRESRSQRSRRHSRRVESTTASEAQRATRRCARSSR